MLLIEHFWQEDFSGKDIGAILIANVQVIPEAFGDNYSKRRSANPDDESIVAIQLVLILKRSAIK